MEKKVQHIIATLKDRYPDAPCALHYKKDYELMIAVRLSAQCTDARVNLVTPELFATYPTLEAMAAADITNVERIIHSCGFFRQKAKFLNFSMKDKLLLWYGYATDAMDRCTDRQIAEYIDMPLWLVPPVRWLHALVQIVRKKR